MIKEFNISCELADKVNEELMRWDIEWNYYPITILKENLDSVLSQQQKNYIECIEKRYGPVKDSQRITMNLFDMYKHKFSYENLMYDINSPFRKKFKFLPILISELVDNNCPSTHQVKRIIVNRQFISPCFYLNGIHPDAVPGKKTVENDLSLLYYVDDSDGDTHFFVNDECIYRAKPNKGNAVLFESKIWHAGALPIKHDTRTTINIMFTEK